MSDHAPRAWLLSIGSELLLGETMDSNAAFLGAELARAGVDLRQTRHLPDDPGALGDAFREARATCDLVLATGGLGPTHDDVTRDALAAVLDEPLLPDPDLEAALRDRFATYGRMPDSNLRQAALVASAEPLPNPIGSAPGWWVDRTDGAVVALMPGVPSEMRRMWAGEVLPRLTRRFTLRPIHVRTLKSFGVGESLVADRLGDLLSSPPAGVEAGIYARDDGVHVRFSTRGDPSALDGPARDAAMVLGGDVWGADGDDLGAVALRALGQAGATSVASWEADTGGALLAILAQAEPGGGPATYVGGILDAGGASGPPLADAVIQLSLLPPDADGRSHVRVAVSGTPSLPQEELRIHGSGPQRVRRAAFAALDHVRRGLRSD
ncbi:MAG TPA: molybdopterin-binding protein [Candidatus Limnocylindria bacterium]|nr:molybdopterin-binding protein [Candidatus Limnocylindria bacterium]